MVKNAFCFFLKPFFVSKHLNFCPEFLFMQKRQLDQKSKADFKIHDVTTWLTNNNNTYIAQYLTK